MLRKIKKNVIFYTNIVLIVTVVLITINIFNLPGSKLIRIALAHTGIGTDGSGISKYLARFTGAQGSSSTTVGNSVIYQDDAGNVGIGTAAPTQKLAFGSTLGNLGMSSADANDTGLLQVSGGGTAGTSRGAYINFYGNENAQAGKLQLFSGTGTGSGNKIEFLTDESGGVTAKMTILPNGNVGIGTTNPNYTLDVNGAIRNRTSADGSPYTKARLWIYGGAGVDPGNLAYIGYGTDAVTRFVYGKTGGSPNLAFGVTTDVGDNTGIFNPKVWFDGSGNVGIGTTGPGATLQIGAAGGSFPGCNNAYLCAVNSDQGNGRDVFRIGTNLAGQIMVFNNVGNVGIGTTAPSDTLDVVTPIDGGGVFISGSVNNVELNLQNTGAGGRRYSWDSTSGTSGFGQGKMVLRDRTTGNDARIVVDAAGNVGIGTTNPTAKLEVNGAIRLVPGAPTGTLVNGMMWMVP